ncbi:MAG: S-layer homology domain-containing protein [Ruminococcaceae bacterium]|nr:S-layer homology domain-containing protein [Oscillospiraceae bacterium]
MKQLKKLIFLLLLPTLFLSTLCMQISAEDYEKTPLSPALSIIACNLQMRKSGLTETSLYFSPDDFEDFMQVDNLKSLTITSLPSEFEGKLYLGNVPVISNQKIFKSDVNKLHFKPASNEVKEATFRFFGNGTSCETSIKCSLYLLSEINTAPTVSEDVSSKEKLTTLKNIMVYSTLHAEDAENDEIFFEITTEPTHGIVNFTNINTGSFTYTPAIDYVGKDKFEYVVYDTYGNRSEKAWVEIAVEKNSKDIFFSDMLRHEDHNFAVKAASYDIMTGKVVDGKYCFMPNNTPTKAEFLCMALKAAGLDHKINNGITGFDDDSDIPSSLKGYVNYAVSEGFITGTKTDKGVFFYPNSPITRAEAAVMINNIINAKSEKIELNFSDSSDIPSWAHEDVSILAALNIMNALSDGSYSPNSNITNAQAAKIFCNLVEFKASK